MHAFNSSLCGFIWGIGKNVKVVSLFGFFYQIVKYLGNLCEELYADFYNYVWGILDDFVTCVCREQTVSGVGMRQ